MKNCVLFLFALLCLQLSITTIHADVIADPLVMIITSPILLLILILAVIVLTVLLQTVKSIKREDTK